MLKFSIGFLLLAIGLVAFWNYGREQAPEWYAQTHLGPGTEQEDSLSLQSSGEPDEAQAGREALEPSAVPQAASRADSGAEEFHLVQLHVQLRSKDEKQAPALAGIELEYGLSSRWGRSLTQALLFSVAKDKLFLGEGTSNEQGVMRVELALPLEYLERHEQAVIWLKPKTQGWMTSYHFAQIPMGIQRLVEMQLNLHQGGTMRGLVKLPDGQPAAGCTLRAYATNEAGMERIVGEACLTDASGAFEYNLDYAGDLRLRAFKQNAGTMEFWLHLDPKSPPQDLLLYLEGAGELAGRLVDPDGNPMRSMSLRVIRQLVRGETRAGQSNNGLTSSDVVTDAQGRFHFKGLCQGSFILVSMNDTDKALHSDFLTTGTLGIKLELQHHRVVLRFVDAKGEPMDPSSPAEGRLNGAFLAVLAPVEGVDLDQPGRHYISGKWGFRVTERALIADVQVGATYRVGLRSNEGVVSEQEVTIEADRWLTEVTLSVPDSIEGTPGYNVFIRD